MILAAIALLGAYASPAAADNSHDSYQITDMPAAARNTTGEWSDERLLSSEPIEETIDPGELQISTRSATTSKAVQKDASTAPTVIVEPGAPPSTLTNVKVNGAFVPSTVGRLYSVTPNGKDYYCTASVVASDTKNLIYTAAHCVYNKDNPEFGADGWHSSFVFIPAYHEKLVDNKRVPQAPFGQWMSSHASVYQGWTVDRDRSFDQAFLTLDPSVDGRLLQDLVGANGLTYDEPTPQLLINAWGYPRWGDYETQRWRPHRCSLTMEASSEVVPDGVRMMCKMTAGSSGGPWIKARSTANYGYVVAVTSGRMDGDDDYIHGAPNTEDTKVLYEHREELSS